MPGVRVVQVPGDEVIDVISVRDALVPTRGPMRVARRMDAAGVRGRAIGAVRRVHRKHVLVHVIAVRVVQVPVVQVIGVPLVSDRRVPAALAVLVVVAVVRQVVVHRCPPSDCLELKSG